MTANNMSLLRLAYPYNWIFFSLQIAFYLLAIFGERAKRLPFGKWLYIPAFLVNSNKAALFGLVRFLTGKQTTLWTRVQRR